MNPQLTPGTSIQLVAVRQRVATIRVGASDPVEIASDVLRAAAQQDGPLGLVYGWLFREYAHCEWVERQGDAWSSPARTVEEIVASEEARLAREAEEQRQEGARRERERIAEEKRRERLEEELRVDAERAETAPDSPWWPIPSWEVPKGIRFNDDPYTSGQIVTTRYGTFGAGAAGECDPYMQILDRSDRSLRHYQRREVK